MARFVLVHGAWHGAWCWRDVIPRLAALGHEAVAIDLPGHGSDPTPIENVTLQDYVDRTLQVVKASGEPPILVGHSMGGSIVRQAAGLAPERVRAIVSVTSLLPGNGVTMLSLMAGLDAGQLSEILWAEDRRSARLSPNGVRRLAYSRCPQETVDAVLPLLTSEPVLPYETPFSVRHVDVPHYYIECLQDRFFPIAAQRSMHTDLPPDHIYALDAFLLHARRVRFHSQPHRGTKLKTTPFGGRFPPRPTV